MYRDIHLGDGSLRVGPRPRGADWLPTDLADLKSAGFSFVVSLLTVAENRELELENERAECRYHNLDFYSFPVVDRSLPEDREAFESLAGQLLARVVAGESGFLHCRAGLGRAPLFACTMLTLHGMDLEQAWALIQDFRGQTVPDTPAQKVWPRTPSSPLSFDEALANLQADSDSLM